MRAFTCFSILLSTTLLAATSEPSRVSNDSPADDRIYPALSLPFTAGSKATYYDMVLEPNTELPKANLQKRKFRAVDIAPGESIEISSYLIATHALDAYQKFEKGADAPTIEQIRTAFDNHDSTEFVKILTKLAEQRRGAYTKKEVQEIVDGTGQSEDDVLFDDHLFGTGFIEVVGKNIGNGDKSVDKDIRYFVPAEQILRGNVKIDLAKSKLHIVRTISAYMFKDLTDSSIDPKNTNDTKLTKTLIEMESCVVAQCTLAETAPIGSLATDLFDVFELGKKKMYTDPSILRLSLRKQMCILKKLYSACPSPKTSAQLEKLIQKEKIDCTKLRTLLFGLKVEK